MMQTRRGADCALAWVVAIGFALAGCASGADDNGPGIGSPGPGGADGGASGSLDGSVPMDSGSSGADAAPGGADSGGGSLDAGAGSDAGGGAPDGGDPDAGNPATDAGTAQDSGSTPRDATIDDIDTGVIDTGPIEREDCGKIELTIRDFRGYKWFAPGDPYHQDFEAYFQASEVATTGIVATMLGNDRKPVYASRGAERNQVTSQATFDQWYRDVDGTNRRHTRIIELTEQSPGTFVYNNNCFFPIDDDPLGGELWDANAFLGGCGGNRNFHFTTEIHTEFEYRGGERFTFRGDDDLWIFVNGRLALDLGGNHPPLSGTIDFDAQAAALGITIGETYPMDIFHAERHTVQSNFRFETNIQCLVSVPIN